MSICKKCRDLLIDESRPMCKCDRCGEKYKGVPPPPPPGKSGIIDYAIGFDWFKHSRKRRR